MLGGGDNDGAAEVHRRPLCDRGGGGGHELRTHEENAAEILNGDTEKEKEISGEFVGNWKLEMFGTWNGCEIGVVGGEGSSGREESKKRRRF